MSFIKLCQCFRIGRTNFDLCKTVEKDICDVTFQTSKISNSIVNGIIFFRANNVKYIALS